MYVFVGMGVHFFINKSKLLSICMCVPMYVSVFKYVRVAVSLFIYLIVLIYASLDVRNIDFLFRIVRTAGR